MRHVYRFDLRATVTTLPKYGTLYVWNGPGFKGDPITAVEGQQLHTAPCYGDCRHKFNVGNTLFDHYARGSKATHNLLPPERRVVYVPNPNWLGTDTFRYRVVAGGVASRDEGEVSVNVRVCRVAGGCGPRGEGYGDHPVVDARLRTPWTWAGTENHPYDRFGEDGRFWAPAYCSDSQRADAHLYPPCNPIP